jgi:glutamyl-tRNA synthetase
MSVRVRFAPSPTGPLHIGGVRTALYNYLFAKQAGGQFVLRIEDTDQKRFVAGAEKYIQESLAWCGIVPDESPALPGAFGPYRQSERKELYKPYIDQLLKDGRAYYAFDTAEELEAVRERAKKAGSVNWQYNSVTRQSMRNSLSLSSSEVDRLLSEGVEYTIRIKIERDQEVRLHDIVRGWVTVNSSNLDDKVLFKSDGIPTYHFANVVDDHLMKITHVIRGEEWLPSAPLHVLLYDALSWSEEQPKFAHLPLLLRPDGNGKLSKRDGDRLGFPVFPIDWKPEDSEGAKGFREMGFYPDAFVNMLAFLGWNPATEQEVFSLDELISSFDLEKVGKSGARFDFTKAMWFNQQYLRKRSPAELTQDVVGELKKRSWSAPEQITSICTLMTERASFPTDILDEGSFFFQKELSFNEKAVRKKWKEDSAQHITAFTALLNELSSFDPESIEQAFHSVLTDRELSFGQLGPAVRIALTGGLSGPSVFEICALLGKKACLARLNSSIAALG